MKGYLQLALLVVVVMAAWTRTSLGAMGHNAVATLRGTETVSVLERFHTEVPERIEVTLTEAVATLNGSVMEEGTSRLTPAVRTAIRAHLGAEALTDIEVLMARDVDLAAALERRTSDDTLRNRAVERAKLAGVKEPSRLENYRRYLPQKDAHRADREVGEVLALATALNLRWPVETSARITSEFGERIHPVLKKRRFHNGVDIALPIGTSIAAAGRGTVKHVHEDSRSGKYVVIDHGHGVTTSYCHGSAHRAEKHHPVDAGEEIMLSGNSGRSTGPHLHFTLRIGRKAVDPMPFYPGEAGAVVASQE